MRKLSLLIIFLFLNISLVAANENYFASQELLLALTQLKQREIKLSTSIAQSQELSLNLNATSFLGITASGNLLNKRGYIRFILKDTSNNEHLIYEIAYPFYEDAFTLNNACDETCILEDVIPSSLIIEAVDANIFIDSISYAEEKIADKAKRDSMKAQQKAKKVVSLNKVLSDKKLGWTAGKTPIGDLSYQEKKKLFQGKLPNFMGFEYYKGGVFSVPGSFASNITNVSSIVSFDWRNVHGQNWNTPIRDQMSEPSCWAFGSMAAVESAINLYYNQHLDINLSEQAFVSCMWTIYRWWDASGMPDPPNPACGMDSPTSTLCSVKYIGAVDEACYPYINIYDAYGMNETGACQTPPPNDCVLCGDMCVDFENRTWKIANFSQLSVNPSLPQSNWELLTEERLKEEIINHGPVAFSYFNWSHVMAIVGWETDNQTTWIVKNSWGPLWGEQGYGKIQANLSEFIVSVVKNPIIPPNNTNYSIICVNNDADDYCSWGISDEKPPSCPPCGEEPDCDDSNEYSLHFGAEEICDGQDNNCNGVVDEGCYDCALRVFKGENISQSYFEEINVYCSNFIGAFPQKGIPYPQTERAVLHFLNKCSYPELLSCCTHAELYTLTNEYVRGLCSILLLTECINRFNSGSCLSAENCTDKIDNDKDGFTDAEDQECYQYRKINLTQGWNLIASPYDTPINSSSALASIEGCYQGIYNFQQGIWNMLVPGNMFSNIDTIRPDKGYWIKVNCTSVDWVV